MPQLKPYKRYPRGEGVYYPVQWFKPTPNKTDKKEVSKKIAEKSGATRKNKFLYEYKPYTRPRKINLSYFGY